MEQETGLALINKVTAVDLFKPGAADDILARIEAEVRATPKDISTEKGRDAIKKLCTKITSSKGFVEEQRVGLVSEEKKKLALVDAEGKKYRDRFDALKQEARKPLTDWENAEKDRVANHEENILAMETAGTLDFGATIAEIQERIRVVSLVDLTTFQEFTERGTSTKNSIMSALETKLKIAEKQEADRIEMEEMRAEKEAREKKDREEQIAREAREKAQQEAEVERQRVEQEKFRAEARVKQVEAEKAAAIEKANKDAEEAEKRHAEATKAARERAERESKEAAERAEKSRAQAIVDEQKRIADEKAKEAAETKAREKDKEHKKTINNAAVAALVVAGLTEAQAKIVILAIAKGTIPAVKISY